MFAHLMLRRESAVGVVAMGVLAACSASESMTNGRSSMTLSFATQGASSNASISASSIPVTSGGHTLDLTAVTLGITKVELHDVAKGEMEK